MSVRILIGDCREKLRDLPDASVNCCVTSPPYFGLRDYGTAQWEGGDDDCPHEPTAEWISRKSTANAALGGGTANMGAAAKGRFYNSDGSCPCGARRVDRQMGLEPTPDEFVVGMVGVFREVRRVLSDDGTLWLNIGDSYAGSWGAQGRGGAPSESSTLKGNGHSGGGPKVKSLSKVQIAAHPQRQTQTGTIRQEGLKPKDLIGIPWMLAFALRADGWYLRQDIIWSKPNPMPESVRDRCTKAHEYLFLLSKGPRYYFDAEAIAEPVALSTVARLSQDVEAQLGSDRVPGKTNGTMKAVGRGGKNAFRGQGAHRDSDTGAANRDGRDMQDIGAGDTRNKRSVWEVATQPFSEAHFATYPPALIEPCILAGCPEFTCPDCGIALDQTFVAGFKAGTNGNDLPAMQVALREGPVEDGQEPLLQSAVHGGRSSLGDSALRGVRQASSAGSKEPHETLLQPGLREQSDIATAGVNEGLDDNIAGISLGDGQGPSERVELRICAGAPQGDGDDHRALSAARGGGSSSEQQPVGQSTGEPGAAEQDCSRQTEQGQAETGQGNVPMLPNSDPSERPCPNCKSRLTRNRLRPGVTLDPFGGAGTTGLVADRLQRDAILIELNPEYAELAERRIAGDAGMFAEVAAA